MSQLESRLDRLAGDSTADLQRLSEVEKTLEAYRLRLAELDAGLAAVVVRGESPGKSMELAEVEYLLRTANERLLLFGDTRAADRAMLLADEQLATLDDPVYLPVRQAIAGARQDLAEMPSPDHIELTERLGRLQAGIPGLPFPDEADLGTREEEPVAEGEEPGIWDRFKATLSGLVTVRRKVPEDELISIEDKEYVRQGLWLQLETARLALMRQDGQLYRSSLERAELTIEQYLDGDQEPVERALDSLDSLLEADLEVEYPDISEPLDPFGPAARRSATGGRKRAHDAGRRPRSRFGNRA